MGVQITASEASRKIFLLYPPKGGTNIILRHPTGGTKSLQKITRRLVQKCTTWFRSTNFTSCSPQNHCTVIFYYGTRYKTTQKNRKNIICSHILLRWQLSAGLFSLLKRVRYTNLDLERYKSIYRTTGYTQTFTECTPLYPPSRKGGGYMYPLYPPVPPPM